MHNRKVIHKDVKLENILFETDDPKDWTVQLIDFGLSKKYVRQSELYRERGGTLYTMSPEALDGVYTTKLDVWSVGVVAYLLISGDRPFRGKTPQEMVTNILEGELVFDAQVWKRRSPECKDFISLLLQKDADLRPDAEAALNHSWFLKHVDDLRSSTSEEVLASVRERLIHFSEHTGDFKRLALNVMAKRSGAKELHDVRDAFLRIDEGNDGVITMDEFKKVLCVGNSTKDYSDEEIESIFRKLVSARLHQCCVACSVACWLLN